jgi:hypothetical protein
MVLVMIPKGKSIEHVWDHLIDWAKRRKADRARLQREKDRELQRKVVLGADALVNAAVRGFFRGVAIAIGIVALLLVAGAARASVKH